MIIPKYGDFSLAITVIFLIAIPFFSYAVSVLTFAVISIFKPNLREKILTNINININIIHTLNLTLIICLCYLLMDVISS